MSFRGARATRNPNHGSLLKISPFGRNDKNGGYSKLSILIVGQEHTKGDPMTVTKHKDRGLNGC